MSRFASALADRQTAPDRRRWVLVPPDQLSDRIGPLTREDPADLGIILVESRWKAARRPYHRQKLALVVANLATLLGVSPRELTDWFWVAYTDAFDWVVEPNVLGMGTFAAGELMTTKPYVSGAAYIHRMSDYCRDCAFDPMRDCPITNLYWAFLDRHRERLAGNPRMGVVMSALRKRAEERLAMDRAVFGWVSETMDRGETLCPTGRPGPVETESERKR